MTFTSYSGHFEDVMLWRAFRCLNKGFYVDICADPADEGSVTRGFYEMGWVGLNIHGDRTAYENRVNERSKDIHLNVAFQHGGVETPTLAQIWKEYLPNAQDVHFLRVDAKLKTPLVIKGNDWVHGRPWVVIVQSDRSGHDSGSPQHWEHLLVENRYQFAYADGVNRFYVAQEHGDLLEHFQYPPNLLDDFKTGSLRHAEIALDEATLKLGLLESRYQQDIRHLQEAKSLIDALQAELAELRPFKRSLMWRIVFLPIRILQAPIRFLLGHDWRLKIKAGVKQSISGVMRKIGQHRKAKTLILNIATRVGIHDQLISFLTRKSLWGSQISDDPYAPQHYWVSTPRSRRVRADLNAAIETVRKRKA